MVAVKAIEPKKVHQAALDMFKEREDRMVWYGMVWFLLEEAPATTEFERDIFADSETEITSKG